MELWGIKCWVGTFSEPSLYYVLVDTHVGSKSVTCGVNNVEPADEALFKSQISFQCPRLLDKLPARKPSPARRIAPLCNRPHIHQSHRIFLLLSYVTTLKYVVALQLVVHLMTTSRNLFQSAGLYLLSYIASPLMSFNNTFSKSISFTLWLSLASSPTSIKHFSIRL